MSSTPTIVKPGRKNAAFKHLMILHWVMAACFLLLYVTGVFVPRAPEALVLAWLIPVLHQSFGTLVMMLLIARIFWLLRVVGRKYSRRLPKVTSSWLQTFVLHSVLYFFMLVAPVSGFILRNAQGIDTTCFGILVPPLVPENEALVELTRSSHFWLSYLFLAFIVLHGLAHWKIVRASWRRACYTLRARTPNLQREQ